MREESSQKGHGAIMMNSEMNVKFEGFEVEMISNDHIFVFTRLGDVLVKSNKDLTGKMFYAEWNYDYWEREDVTLGGVFEPSGIQNVYRVHWSCDSDRRLRLLKEGDLMNIVIGISLALPVEGGKDVVHLGRQQYAVVRR